MIPGGYILQPRKFDESESSNFPPCTREVWLYLLRNVNHKDNGKLSRGVGFFSISGIRDVLCWYVGFCKKTYSKDQVVKALRRLRDSTMIATTKTTRGLIVTICNYDFYQDPKNYEDTNDGTTKAPRRRYGSTTINKNVRMEEGKKTTYGELANVTLSEEEYDKLKIRFNSAVEEKIKDLSLYLASTGKKYKSHYATILAWDRKNNKQSRPTLTAEKTMENLRDKLK